VRWDVGPTVRNTAGEVSDFALDRFVRDAVVRGESLEAARAVGRQLLADLRRARVHLVTTDALRHWILERDPLVFARRRRVRARGAAGWRYLDPALGEIAALAELPSLHGSRLATELFLGYFRPGAGEVMAQAAPDPERAPPLEDLEEQLGDIADGIEWPEAPDYSRWGSVGPTMALPDPTDGRKQLFLFIRSDGTVTRLRKAGIPDPGCDEPFLLDANWFRSAPGCANVDFRAVVRACLLQGLAEAFRACQPSRCERAIPKLLHACWGCGSDTASAHAVLEVRCTAL